MRPCSRYPLLALLLASLAGASPPPRPVLFGLESDGVTVRALPRQLCVRAGERLRLLADTVNWKNERRYEDWRVFHWLLYVDGTSASAWEPATAPDGTSHFQPGTEKNAVYFKAPAPVPGGAVTRLSVRAYTPRIDEIVLVDTTPPRDTAAPLPGPTCVPPPPGIVVRTGR